MSTNDVPGFDPKNHDELAMGCWAEHEDGSLIFVESTEASRIVYTIFDMSKQPVVEYRDAMPDAGFKTSFSWSAASAGKKDKWTWHDKTPFPWDRVIKSGATDGVRYASADDQITAAQRVAESRRAHGRPVDIEALEAMEPLEVPRGKGRIVGKIQKALARLDRLTQQLGE